MKALLVGRTANTIEKMLGSDFSIPVLVCDDDGVPIDISAHTIVAEFFEDVGRIALPFKTITLTARATKGFTDIPVSDGEATLVRDDYYVWIKITLAGAVQISSSPSLLTLR
jgi:hypothetical protein